MVATLNPADTPVQEDAVTDGYALDRFIVLSRLNDIMAVAVDRNDRSHAAHAAGGPLRQMLKADLTAAQTANESYRGLIRYLGNSDPATREMVARLLVSGEAHSDELVAMLARLPA